MAKRTFEQALAVFVKSTKQSMEAAIECAHLSIDQFADSGNLNYAQSLFDAMPKNYARRNAFALWLAAFAPITMKEGKFLKDKSDDAVEVDVAAAKLKPFWDYAPDPTRAPFTASDVIVAMQRTIKRFKNSKHHEPADEAATAQLDYLEDLIAAAGAKVPSTTATKDEAVAA